MRIDSTLGGRTARFGLGKDEIKGDLTDQRPVYPLSCYGPGKDAPRQLIEGSVEVSPEELRLRYYACRAAGNEAAGVSKILHFTVS
jgi:nucleoporin NUP42